MKAEYIRDDMEVSFPVPPGHDGRFEVREVVRNGERKKVHFWKKGAHLEHPDAWMLVQMGVAVPADEACLLRANRNPEELEQARKAYERLRLGIHPDDFELFDQGVILGYLPNGDYKPGPNFKLLRERAPLEEDDDEGSD